MGGDKLMEKMDRDNYLIFDYLNRDRLISHVEINLKTKEIIAKDYATTPFLTVFGKRPKTIESLNVFFRQRCFSEERPDKQVLLEMFGLTEYNLLDIVQKTHGLMTHDKYWIRFDGEDYSYADVLSGRVMSEGINRPLK